LFQQQYETAKLHNTTLYNKVHVAKQSNVHPHVTVAS